VVKLQARVLQTHVGVRAPLTDPGASALLMVKYVGDMALDLAWDMGKTNEIKKTKKKCIYSFCGVRSRDGMVLKSEKCWPLMAIIIGRQHLVQTITQTKTHKLDGFKELGAEL
jgi:hypothetical protein